MSKVKSSPAAKAAAPVKRKRYRSAENGKIVSKAEADKSPATTVAETVKPKAQPIEAYSAFEVRAMAEGKAESEAYLKCKKAEAREEERMAKERAKAREAELDG